jgi:hypothetical protein
VAAEAALHDSACAHGAVPRQPYNPTVTEAAKRMGGVWDPNSKRWIFRVDAYDAVLAAMNELQLPRLKIDGVLPATMRAVCTVPAAADPFDPARLPADLLAALMPFQLEGVRFAVRHGGRVYIGDEMGLGKTIQAISALAYYEQDWPALVVTPSSVRYNWAQVRGRQLQHLAHLLSCRHPHTHTQEVRKWLPGLQRSDVQILIKSSDAVRDAARIFIISCARAARFAAYSPAAYMRLLRRPAHAHD